MGAAMVREIDKHKEFNQNPWTKHTPSSSPPKKPKAKKLTLDDYWARIGREWAVSNIRREGGKARILRREQVAAATADILRSIDKPKVLEVGCNYGENLAYLGSVCKDAELFGIDISEEAIQMAEKRNPGPDYSVSSVYDLPFKKGEFDLVFTMGVMIHLHPNRIKHAIGSIAELSNRHIIHTEVATEELYAKCGKMSNPKVRQYGARQPYLFLHDYKKLYRRTKFALKSQFLVTGTLTTLHFEK